MLRQTPYFASPVVQYYPILSIATPSYQPYIEHSRSSRGSFWFLDPPNLGPSRHYSDLLLELWIKCLFYKYLIFSRSTRIWNNNFWVYFPFKGYYFIYYLDFTQYFNQILISFSNLHRHKPLNIVHIHIHTYIKRSRSKIGHSKCQKYFALIMIKS